VVVVVVVVVVVMVIKNKKIYMIFGHASLYSQMKMCWV
jgi:hypothetical protein